MAVNCNSTDPAFYENCGASAMGLQPYGAIGNGNLDGWIATAVAQSTPAGANSGYKVACEACLRARGLLYWKQQPGDCQGAGGAVPGITTPQITGLAGTAASGAIGAIGAAGIIGGAATLGISAAISVAVAGIETIFAHHAAAVANEQSTICAVANYFNPLIKQIDAAVKSGSISSDQGILYLQQIVNSAKTGLSTIEQKCNAACVYQGILQAHLYFSKNYYPFLSPPQAIYAQAPGNPPDGWGTPPGGVTVTGNTPPPPQSIRSTAENTYTPSILGSAPPIASNAQLAGNVRGSDYLNLGYNQQTGQSAQAADVPTVGVNWTMVGAVVGIIALLLVVNKG